MTEIEDMAEMLEDLYGFQLMADLDADEIEFARLRLDEEMHPRSKQQVESAHNMQALQVPEDPLSQAMEVDPGYRARPHLKYLSDRIAAAVKDVENGQSRMLKVSMPPRMGKSTLSSIHTPVWLLRTHPDWNLGLVSHDPGLAVNWGRQVRDFMVNNQTKFGVSLKRDAGAAAEWETTANGGIVSRSVGQSITGRGFKVLLVDDAVKDFADAHSAAKREALWNWWQANAYTRLEGPFLVIFIGTRWHEDDLLGRITSPEYEQDPGEFEIIEFPAIAEQDDVLGRKPGEPLLSPLTDETPVEALNRWAKIKKAVGSYAWAALYQQTPSPAQGAIFNTDWWRYWTTVPALADKDQTGSPRIVLLNPEEDLKGARWLDSWDMAFKKTDQSDYVVGQRWAQKAANKFLMYQERARMTFTETLAKMRSWGDPNGGTPHANRVHERLVEDKANGTAVIDTLKDEISGLIPINPTDSKEARARAVTPDVEAGNVLLPLPAQPGNEWVVDYVSEMRDFPSGAHDDQVDSSTQALSRMRTPQKSSIQTPASGRKIQNSRARAAQTQRSRGTPRIRR